MLKLLRMRSTPLLPSLPDLLWPGVVAPDRVLSMDQIEVNWILMINWIVWYRTVDIETAYLGKIELFEIELFWHLIVNKNQTELFEI